MRRAAAVPAIIGVLWVSIAIPGIGAAHETAGGNSDESFFSELAAARTLETNVRRPQDFTAGERIAMPGLPNLARVADEIYRGGRPLLSQGGIESLRKLGIKKIIDLQGGDLTSPRYAWMPGWKKLISRLEPGETPNGIAAEIAAARAVGIKVINIPLDSLDPVTPAEAKSLGRILKMLARSAADPIYVHCEHGKDRTGLVIALYRVSHDHWSQKRAAREMAAMGHAGYWNGLFTGNMDLNRVLALYPNLGL
ncbi:MAG: fused DSP-PTPase phosphatase/NAD kinase-like protein [Elusimicrobiota bacterium]